MFAELLPLLTEIFEVCILPLLGILTTYLIKYINVKSAEVIAAADSETSKKYLSMLSETITACVIATNQTYVDALKKQGKFDAAAQKEAFKMTLDSVLLVLSDEAKNYLTSIYGDLNIYLAKQIEATVNQNKISV